MQRFLGHTLPTRGSAVPALAWAVSSVGSDTGRLLVSSSHTCALTRLRPREALLAAPRLAPQPALVKRKDWDLILHAVG